jgi:lactonase
MTMKLKSIAIMVLLSGAALFSIPGTVLALPAVVYQAHASFFPKLPGEQNLQTVVAEKWLQVSKSDMDTLEGLCFDRHGNLWMVGVQSGKVFKVTPDKHVTVVATLKGKLPAGLKIHKDGRIFVAYLGDCKSTGGVVSLNPDGSDMKQVVAEGKYVADDLFFDSKGGFYFTNFKGIVGSSIGTVEYVSPDFTTITTVVGNLTGPNGLVMTPKLKDTLFIAETCAARLDRFNLEPDGTTIKPYGGSVLYNYQGGNLGPDSLETDADGNLYQAMWGQGRFVLLDCKTGIPFAQILVPDRDKGHMLYTSHSSIIPGTNQVILAANDLEGGQGMALYTVKVPAKAWNGYYQFQH